MAYFPLIELEDEEMSIPVYNLIILNTGTNRAFSLPQSTHTCHGCTPPRRFGAGECRGRLLRKDHKTQFSLWTLWRKWARQIRSL
jgi:hypothetical protein